jgi:hypothetical protein
VTIIATALAVYLPLKPKDVKPVGLFTLKQKHEGSGYGCQSTASNIVTLLDIPSHLGMTLTFTDALVLPYSFASFTVSIIEYALSNL